MTSYDQAQDSHLDIAPEDRITVFPQIYRSISQARAKKTASVPAPAPQRVAPATRSYAFRTAAQMRGETLATILNTAADAFLKTELGTLSDTAAIDRAINKSLNQAFPYGFKRHITASQRIHAGLEELGFKLAGDRQFKDVPEEERKIFRHTWLKFAAHLAKEQGV